MATWEEFEPIVKECGLNAIWLRSACKCEYCGVNLLETPQVLRAESDHLLPQAKYPMLISTLNNYVMACTSCHKLKGQFDPGEGDERLKGLGDISDQERTERICTVKDYLKDKRKKQDDEMQQIRETLLKHGLRS